MEGVAIEAIFGACNMEPAKLISAPDEIHAQIRAIKSIFFSRSAQDQAAWSTLAGYCASAMALEMKGGLPTKLFGSNSMCRLLASMIVSSKIEGDVVH